MLPDEELVDLIGLAFLEPDKRHRSRSGLSLLVEKRADSRKVGGSRASQPRDFCRTFCVMRDKRGDISNLISAA